MSKQVSIKEHIKALNAGHKVKIRLKSLKDGLYSIYLDCWIGHNQPRSLTYLDLRITGDRDNDRDALTKAEIARAHSEAELSDLGGLKAEAKRKADFITYFRIKASRSDNWKAAYKKFTKFYRGSLPFKKLNGNLIEEFKTYLMEGMAPSAAATYLKILKACFNEAIREGYLVNNPAKGITIKVPESERSFLTQDDIEKMKTTVIPSNYQIREAFMFSCYTGLRISDIRELKWSNIQDDQISLRQKKTRSMLYIPLLKQAQEILDRLPKNGDQVFYLPTTCPLNDYLRAWADEAGLGKRITYHSSRHTFAILALEAGVDIAILQKLLGHTMLTTTMHYAKVKNNMMRKAAEKMSSFIG